MRTKNTLNDFRRLVKWLCRYMRKSILPNILMKPLFPFLDPKDHLDLDFKWDMTGSIQVFMNEGINYLKEGNPNPRDIQF